MTVGEAIQVVMALFNNYSHEFTTMLLLMFAIHGAGLLVRIILKSAQSNSLEIEKKSYHDEMSVYDNEPVQQIETLPPLSGLSIDQLIDGELPESAYTKDAQ